MDRGFLRRLRYGSNAVIITIAVILIAVMINVLAAQSGIKFDVTQDKQFSLSDQTLEVLKKLDKDVKVTAFFQDGSTDKEYVETLLNDYKKHTDKLQVTFVDPDKNPDTATQYNIQNYDTVVFESGGNKETVEAQDIFPRDYTSGSSYFAGEEAFTKALISLGNPDKPVVYFVTGHGELDLFQQMPTFREKLTSDGYNVMTLNIAQEGKIPDDASLLVFAGPRQDMMPQEAEIVKKYFENGGHALFMIDPPVSNLQISSYENLFNDWGIQLRKDIVVDPSVRQVGLDVTSIVPEYNYHEITNKLDDQNLMMIVPGSRSIVISDDYKGNADREALLTSTASAWGETNFNESQVKKDDNDTAGPLTLAVAVSIPLNNTNDANASNGNTQNTQTSDNSGNTQNDQTGSNESTPTKEGRVVIVGSTTLATENAIRFYGNMDFLVNSINWAAQREDLISIRAKSLTAPQMFLTAGQSNFILFFSALIIPLIVFACGGVVWWRRRYL